MKDEKRIEIIERLSILILSKEYQNDFKKFKQEILSRKEKFQYYSGWVVNFDEEEFERLGRREYDKKYPLRVSSEDVKVFLKDGNINDHLICIPRDYSDFKKRWNLTYFFDPLKDYRKSFNPFEYKFPVIPCLGPFHRKQEIPNDPDLLVIRHKGFFDPKDDYYKAWIEVDTREPMKVLRQEIDEVIQWYKRNRKPEGKSQRGRPRKRYSQLKEMIKIWEEHCEGHKLGNYEQSQIIYSALKESHGDDSPWPVTISRHYLPMIKKATKNK